MSGHEDTFGGYRVKFVDMRIARGTRRKPAGGERRSCDHPGCDKPASCKAPAGHRKLNHSMFCYRHAAQCNRAHNYFDSMSQNEFEAFMEAERIGHKQTWRFGQGPAAGAARAEQYWRGRDPLDPSPPKARPIFRRTRLQVRCLKMMGLEESARAGQIRARYASLVKAYHPDSNSGDRAGETDLARVIKAFKTLKATGLV